MAEAVWPAVVESQGRMAGMGSLAIPAVKTVPDFFAQLVINLRAVQEAPAGAAKRAEGEETRVLDQTRAALAEQAEAAHWAERADQVSEMELLAAPVPMAPTE